jgi:predicted transcriptional regulator
MRTVTIDVADRATLNARAQAAFRGEHVGDFISFDSPEALWRVLTPRRWEIVKALAGQGPVGVRALARQLGRDVKGVHTDTQALVQCGVLDKSDNGKVAFPYDAVHVDFTISRAA